MPRQQDLIDFPRGEQEDFKVVLLRWHLDANDYEVTALEADPEAPTFMPPPQPDHRHIANDKTTMPVNFTREELFVPTISDPLS